MVSSDTISLAYERSASTSSGFPAKGKVWRWDKVEFCRSEKMSNAGILIISSEFSQFTVSKNTHPSQATIM